MLNLPFREVWTIDFEFLAPDGALPEPVCLVGRELITGRLVRLWGDELAAGPPFAIDDDVLFVGYYMSAEVGCFVALGWPVPTRILDLYTEFRNETNGIQLPAGRGLLGALSYHGVPGITSEQKADDRALVMRGGPWSDDERRRILDYCQTDVDPLGALVERMWPRIAKQTKGFGQALLRGRYMAAVARMESAGVPIDVDMLDRLRRYWSTIKGDLIAAIDKDYGVFDKTGAFRTGLFAGYLYDQGIDWPRTATGLFALDRETFRTMSDRYPQLQPLRELRNTLAELRLESLTVGPDDRNRVLLSPFGARSGRNTPSNSKFVFGPSVWIRGLIKPPAGRAIAYIDWSSQKVAIAAVLSGDSAMLEAVTSGDPYLAFAKMAGLAPADATKETYKAVRDMCKTCVLGTQYGMQAPSLALRTGLSAIEASNLLRRLAQTFPVFWTWAQQVADVGQLTGYLSTVFGWTLRTETILRPTTLRNFPMQANGAEMMRLACCLATERGIQVCAPIHDALLIEAAAGDIDDAIATTQSAMAEASAAVLGGYEIGTDAEVVVWPDRYADPRGAVMWQRMTQILARCE